LGFPKDLSINLGLVLVYWLTSIGQLALSPIVVIHAVLGAIMSLFVVGHSISVAALGRAKFDPVSLRGRMAFEAVLSIVFLTICSCGLAILNLLSGTNLTLILASVIIGSNVIDIARSSLPVNVRPVAVNLGAYVSIIISFGLTVGFVFRRAFVWPAMPGWDTYVHLGVANWIFKNDGMTNIFPISSGSVLPYPYVFHVLVASFSDILGCSPYIIFWLAPFYCIPLYGMLVYGLASVWTESKIQSLFAALLATSVSGGEVLLGPQYFFPSTAFILIFMLCLIAIVDSPLRRKAQAAFVLVALATCYSLYYFPLFLTLVPVIIVVIRRNPQSFLERWRTLILVTALTTTVLLTYVGSLLLSSGSLSFAVKAGILEGAYPDLLWLFIISGGFVIIWLHFKGRRVSSIHLSLLAYVATLVGLFFLPISDSYRSELLLRPFAAIVASYVLVVFTGLATSLHASRVNLDQFLRSARRPIKISLVVFLAVSIGLLVQPYFVYGQQVQTWSNMSSDEYQAAQWLGQNTPNHGYILTDPSTGFVLRGLTLLNCSTSFIVGGHTPTPQGNFSLTSIIYDFFTSQATPEMISYLNKLPQTPDFVVVTTRTASWSSWGGINSTFPAPTQDMPDSFAGSQKFSSPLFQLVEGWGTVRIYRMTGAQLQTVWNAITSPNLLGPWYLDGVYGNHSIDFQSGSLKLTVQSRGPENAWTGPTFPLANLTNAISLRVNYRIDAPSYALEVALWHEVGSYDTLYLLPQKPGWNEWTTALPNLQQNNLTKIAIILWTKDTQIHTVEINKFDVFGYT